MSISLAELMYISDEYISHETLPGHESSVGTCRKCHDQCNPNTGCRGPKSTHCVDCLTYQMWVNVTVQVRFLLKFVTGDCKFVIDCSFSCSSQKIFN